MLGGRSVYERPDGTNPDGPAEQWKPDMAMVRTVIKFAMETGRLDFNQYNKDKEASEEEEREGEELVEEGEEAGRQ